jgi:hypothetical protein
MLSIFEEHISKSIKKFHSIWVGTSNAVPVPVNDQVDLNFIFQVPLGVTSCIQMNGMLTFAQLLHLDPSISIVL